MFSETAPVTAFLRHLNAKSFRILSRFLRLCDAEWRDVVAKEIRS